MTSNTASLDDSQTNRISFSSPKPGADIKAGDVLLRSTPYVSLLDREHRGFRCHNCFRPLPPSHWRCPICRDVAYCNQTCRDQQASLHPRECSFLTSAPTASDTARLMMKLMIRMKEEGEEDGEAVPGRPGFRKFEDLLSHREEIVHDQEKFDIVCKTYQELKGIEVEDLPDFDIFVDIFGKMLINGFAVRDIFLIPVATCLYLAPSILDHSCNPNALWYFEGNAIVIRAIEDIPDFCISKVRISYMDLLNERSFRVFHLMKNYYFICDCSRCNNPESEESFNSIWCPNCHGKTCLTIGMRIKCHLCGEPFTHKLEETYAETLLKLNACFNQLILAPTVILECIEEMIQDFLLHPDNIYYVKAVKMAFDVCFDAKRYAEAWRYGGMALSSIRKYKHLIPSGFIQMLIKLAMVEIEMDASEVNALEYLEEAKQRTALIYGEQSELHRAIDRLLGVL